MLEKRGVRGWEAAPTGFEKAAPAGGLRGFAERTK